MLQAESRDSKTKSVEMLFHSSAESELSILSGVCLSYKEALLPACMGPSAGQEPDLCPHLSNKPRVASLRVILYVD